MTLIVLALTVGCQRGRTVDKATFGGGRAVSDGFAISSPNLFIRDGTPGVAFGAYGVPNTPDGLGYFVIFKHPPGSLAQSGFAPRSCARCEADGLLANLKLDLQGVQLKITHRLALNAARTGIANETLSIQDKTVDVSAGRFFYVDLTAKQHRIEQLNLPLPTLTANLQHPAEVERFAEETIRALAARSPEVTRLVKR